MVENSKSPMNACRAGFPAFTLPDQLLHPLVSHPHLLSAPLSCLCQCATFLLASVTLKRMSRGPATEDSRGLLQLSIAGWFFPLPWLGYAAGSVAPEDCHLALAAW